MTIKEMVSNYYSLISKLVIKKVGSRDNLWLVIDNAKAIRKAIKETLEGENNYLLTPGYITYIVESINNIYFGFDKTMCLQLEKLNEKDKTVKRMLYYIKNSYETIDEELLTEFEKELFGALKIAMHNVTLDADDGVYYPQDYNMIKQLLFILASYVLVNKKTIDDFYDYAESFIFNWDTKLEEIKLQINVVYDDTEEEYFYNHTYFEEYIIQQLDNKKTEIR